MSYTYAGTLFSSPNTVVKQNPANDDLILPSTVSVCEQGTTNPITLYTDRSRGAVAANAPMATGVQPGDPGIDIAGNIWGFADPGHYTIIIDGVPYPLTVYPDPDEPPQSTSSPAALQFVTSDTTCNNNNTTGLTIPGITVPLSAGAGVVVVVGKLNVISTSAANIQLGASITDASGYLHFWAFGPDDTVVNPGGTVHEISGPGNWFRAQASGGTTVTKGYFGGFTTGGSRQTIQFGAEASQPTSGQLTFSFMQENAVAYDTKVLSASSYATVFRS